MRCERGLCKCCWILRPGARNKSRVCLPHRATGSVERCGFIAGNSIQKWLVTHRGGAQVIDRIFISHRPGTADAASKFDSAPGVHESTCWPIDKFLLFLNREKCSAKKMRTSTLAKLRLTHAICTNRVAHQAAHPITVTREPAISALPETARQSGF